MNNLQSNKSKNSNIPASLFLQHNLKNGKTSYNINFNLNMVQI